MGTALAPRHIPAGTPDSQLVRQAALGEERAFDEIDRRYRDQVLRACRRTASSENDAHEATQRAFILAWEAIASKNDAGHLAAWLTRIALNELTAMHRSSRPSEPLDEQLLSHAPEPDQVAAARADVEEVFADLRSLSPGQRDALHLHAVADLDYESVASILGIRAATARRAVADARIALSDIQHGRALPCNEARQRITAADRRILRARDLRAHLRSCEDCRTYAAATGRKRAAAAVLPFGWSLRSMLGRLKGIRHASAGKMFAGAKTLAVILAIGCAAGGVAAHQTARSAAKPRRRSRVIMRAQPIVATVKRSRPASRLRDRTTRSQRYSLRQTAGSPHSAATITPSAPPAPGRIASRPSSPPSTPLTQTADNSTPASPASGPSVSTDASSVVKVVASATADPAPVQMPGVTDTVPDAPGSVPTASPTVPAAAVP